MVKRIILPILSLLVFFSCENLPMETIYPRDLVYSNWDIEDYDLVVLGYGDSDTDEGKAFALIMYNFKQDNPDITIKWDMKSDEEFHFKLTMIFYNGDQLDVTNMWNEYTRHQPVSDANETIDQLQFIDKSLYEPEALIGAGKDGELFAIPIAKQVHTIMYSNNNLLTELGLTPATTYQELLDQHKIAEENNKITLAYPGATPWCHNTFIYPALLGRFGGAQHTKDLIAKKAKFTDQPTIKSLEFIERMVSDGILNSVTVGSDYGVSLAQFNNSEALYFIDGGWRTGSITIPDFSLNKFVSVPDEVYPGTMNGGYSAGYAIMKSATLDDTRRRNAVKLLKYLTGEEASIIRAKIMGLVPTFKIPFNKMTFPADKKSIAAFTYSASSITETVGDYIDAKTCDYLSDGIVKLMSGSEIAGDLAKETQEIYIAN